MKQLKIFFICMLALSVSVYASDGGKKPAKKSHGGGDSKIFVGLGIGAGIPMLNYGKADTLSYKDSTHITGYAKTGFQFNVYGGYKFSDNIGIMIQIGGNMNGFDADTYKKKNFGPNSTSVVTGTSHYIGSYLAGPVFIIPAGDKIAINFKLLGGLMTASYSTLTYTYQSGPPFYINASSISSVKSASTFGYDIGIGAKIKLTDMFGLNFGVDYLGGSPTFKSYTTTSGSTSRTYDNQNKNMSVGIINISAGIVLSF